MWNASGVVDDAERSWRAFFPTLHIIGAPKTGSSSLHDYVARAHICGPYSERTHERHKELPMWYYGPWAAKTAAAEYALKFRGPLLGRLNQSCAAFADSTPTRLASGFSPRELARLAAGAQLRDHIRIIVILREPISRHLSWYNHRLAQPVDFHTPDPFSFWRSEMRQCPSFKRLPTSAVPSHAMVAACHLEKWQSSGCQTNTSRSSASVQCWQRQAQRVGTFNWVVESIYAPALSLWTAHWPRKQILVLQFGALISEGMGPALDFAGIRLSSTGASVQHASLPLVNTKDSACKARLVECATQHAMSAVFDPWNEVLLAQLRDDVHAGRAPTQEPAFAPFVVQSLCESRTLPPVNLSQCVVPAARVVYR